MQRIILMRHAKSDWSQPGVGDKERVLNERGRLAAPRMGLWLANQDIRIGQVRSSSSARTRETWDRMQGALQVRSESRLVPQFLDELYLATASTLWQQAESYFGTPDNHGAEGTLLLLAHNPGLELLVQALSHEDHEFPTASVAIFEREGSGPISGLVPAIEGREWKLVKLQSPKQLAT